MKNYKSQKNFFRKKEKKFSKKFTQSPLLFNNPRGNQKANIIAINVLITRKLTTFKKKIINFLQNFLNFLSYLMTIEAIKMQITPLLAR